MSERVIGDVVWFMGWACLVIALYEPRWYMAFVNGVGFITAMYIADKFTGIEEVRR